MSHVRAAGLGAGLLAGLSLLAIGSASAQPGDGRLLPPGFEGRITYEGRYSGTRTNADGRRGGTPPSAPVAGIMQGRSAMK